jgi:hypothetical protein
MIGQIINCFKLERYLYSQHAREEMEVEELGEIKDNEVFEAVLNGKIIEDYPEDVNKVIIITVYQPRSDQWIDFERRKK